VSRWALLALLVGCAKVFDLEPVDPAPPCLADDFDDGAISPTTWSVLIPTSQATVTVDGGELVITLAPITPALNGIRSVAQFDLTHGEIRTELVAPPSATGGVNAGMFVFLDDLNYYAMAVENQLLLLRAMTQNVPDELTAPFDASADRFWRIRHDVASDQMSFETSADSAAWVVKRTVLVTVPLESMRAQYLASVYKMNIAAPGSARFDNFAVVLLGCQP